MICNNADKCKSTECSHRMPHEYDPDLCKEGQCRWAGDTRCVPGDTREELELVIRDIGIELTVEQVDRIMAVFQVKEEEKNE